MPYKFASASLTHDQTNALVKLVGGAEAVKKILNGELKLIVTEPGTGRARSNSGKKKLLASTTPGTKPFPLTVEYDELEEMVAAGNYGLKNITNEHFSLKGKGVVQFEARYFCFNRGISSDDARDAIVGAGWAPAETPHLLAFGVKHPDEQRKFPIVALGSSAFIVGLRYVPVLNKIGAERGLFLVNWVGGWQAFSRFLAVRPVSVA